MRSVLISRVVKRKKKNKNKIMLKYSKSKQNACMRPHGTDYHHIRIGCNGFGFAFVLVFNMHCHYPPHFVQCFSTFVCVFFLWRKFQIYLTVHLIALYYNNAFYRQIWSSTFYNSGFMFKWHKNSLYVQPGTKFFIPTR